MDSLSLLRRAGRRLSGINGLMLGPDGLGRSLTATRAGTIDLGPCLNAATDSTVGPSGVGVAGGVEVEHDVALLDLARADTAEALEVGRQVVLRALAIEHEAGATCAGLLGGHRDSTADLGVASVIVADDAAYAIKALSPLKGSSGEELVTRSGGLRAFQEAILDGGFLLHGRRI